jgi:single-strand DNA-binding protein
MNGVNEVTLIGFVGKDAETKLVGEKKTVTKLTVATSEDWKDSATGEKKSATEWHTVEAWDGLAKYIGEYVKKGALVFVRGKIKTIKFEKEGQMQYRTIIAASEVKKLKDAGDGTSRAQSSESGEAGEAAKQTENYASTAQTPAAAVPAASVAFAAQENDDLPF